MKYHKTILQNGLRIITIPMEHTQTVTVMSVIEAGSYYETKSNNGISHFLEHMCFKGTETKSGEEIKLLLDRLGSSNAFTGFEYTGYYIKTQSKNVYEAIDIVSDIYKNPTFPEQDVEREKGVIIEEINMYKDIPQSIVGDVWHTLLFRNQPAGFDILGPEKNIRKFKQKDFVEYHKTHYVPGKTTIVVSGNIEAPKIRRELKKVFTAIPAKKKVPHIRSKNSQTKPQTALQYKKSDQAHVMIGFRSFKMSDERNYALQIAAIILGKGFSSRLFKLLRDEHGLCYYVSAGNSTCTHHGHFAISMGCNIKETKKAISLILDECKKLSDEGVSKDELQKAKDMILNNKALHLETSDQYADFYGFQEVFREDILTPDQLAKKVKAITIPDIQKAMRLIVKDKNLNMAIVGPYKEKQQFSKILKVGK